MAMVAISNFFCWGNVEIEEVPAQQLEDDWRDFAKGIVMRELYEIKKDRGASMTNQEITLAEFVRRSGLTISQVNKLIKKGRIQSRRGYKHRYIPVSELDKVKG